MAACGLQQCSCTPLKHETCVCVCVSVCVDQLPIAPTSGVIQSMLFLCLWQCVCGGGGGYHIKEEGLHGSRGGRPAGGACAKKDV